MCVCDHQPKLTRLTVTAFNFVPLDEEISVKTIAYEHDPELGDLTSAEIREIQADVRTGSTARGGRRARRPADTADRTFSLPLWSWWCGGRSVIPDPGGQLPIGLRGGKGSSENGTGARPFWPFGTRYR